MYNRVDKCLFRYQKNYFESSLNELYNIIYSCETICFMQDRNKTNYNSIIILDQEFISPTSRGLMNS